MNRDISKFDSLQYELVVRCEKPHEVGLRDKPISGDICTRILIDFLAREFPHVSFHSGVISAMHKKPLEYEHSSSELGPQADIIVYTGTPYELIYGYAVVPKRSVRLVLEVKKWIAPKDVDNGLNKQVKKLRQSAGRAVLVVGFRHHGKEENIRETSKADDTFLFSTATPGVYPEYFKDFHRTRMHSGELLRLCEWVDRSF